MSGPSSRASDRARSFVVLALAALLGCSKSAGSGGGDASGDGARKGEPLRVAAAADLALAFKEVGAAFEKQSGKRVDFSFGSTGLLAKQIAEGAPFDVFAAANISFVDDVVREGACLGETKALYAKGRIVMWSKDPWALPKDIKDLEDAKYAKVAIANPEHAPYGRAAREALTKAGSWAAVEPRAVYGENVQQTLMFARSGNADVAIVALSLAVTSPGNYTPIDPSLHAPLDQALVVCKGGSKGPKTNEARAFVDYVGSDAGRAIMKRFGFLLPGETASP
ncbi:MAG: molybdate ABC transporter substrate-binding protein [Myxococcales bacterium 68-20]|nr:molybdate ABC transporter substrate-binding protein [Myxococcales bacterium]OJY21092.1 MAG: molybdate ABC transporter substrate-binding protein [Myxococcales bacterium 68-20]